MAGISQNLSFLNCAISTSEFEHLCEEPVALSCGHYICKECSKSFTDHKNIKCTICNTTNNRDLNQEIKAPFFDYAFNQNLNHLFDLTLGNFKKTFNKCKETLLNNEEKVETHIQFVKDQIQIKIESIKMRLDELYNEFEKELDKIKIEWKSENRNFQNVFEVKKFEDEMVQIEKSLKENENVTKENIYNYQKKIKQLQNILNQNEGNGPTLEFKENKSKFDKELIGQLVFHFGENFDKSILKNLKINDNKTFDVACEVHDFCVLNDENILIANYNGSNLLLYNNNFVLLKTITNINNKRIRVPSITCNEHSNIYINDNPNHSIIKTDLEFNQLALFGNGCGNSSNQLNNPWGICYHKQSVYVCDYVNQRIQKLDSNLVFQSSFPLNYYPWLIKCINDTAVVRVYNHALIYFYNLDNFQEIKKLNGHNGIIGASKYYFYEYFARDKTLYCYKENGELFEQIQMKNITSNENGWGSICIYKSKFLMGNEACKMMIRF